MRVVVVDDHSADGTVSIATSVAKNYPQLDVLHSPPLPPNWTGKSHACWIGARAVPADIEWLCFIDADVWAKPPLLISAITTATAERLDLLSLAPRQQLESFAERLMIPCGLYLLAFCQDLRTVQSRDSKDATATGQFMLIRHAPYDAIGGHASIRSDICEDVALARLLKRSGGHVVLRAGNRLLSTRMYTGWATLWVGLSKNLVDMLGGQRSTLTIGMTAIVLAWSTWLVPIIDAVGCARAVPGSCIALLPGLVGSGAIFGLHIAGASYFRIPMWYGLLFPLGYTVGTIMAFDSVWRRWRGRVSWKGRTYP
jgi:chlorobactene glucosyltransferase